MRQQSLSSRLTYDRPILLSDITSRIADRAQTNTQQYGRRPYGVGLLMVACGIGARSQMARTYLERNLDEFEGSSREELIKHALRALKESLSQDKELTIDNTSLGVSGIGENFHLYEGQDVAEYLETTFENKDQETEQTGEGMEVDDS
jgi:20S proteasome subunit alpha 6